ncbi:MAG TPA: SEC-C metal-binding domain-containing protein [Roseiflexaceae bacterium]|jgi:hypothetical protein|nr:SEC-C metal-binding domain-containing protein [Roseiflexaceae bacterium]
MAKIGRNDPCPCGSGKKYKQCHLPIEEAAQAEQRRLWQAQDELMGKIISAAQEQTADIPAALARFWEGKYTADQLSELDDLEDRGAERFLTWFAFDYVLDDGKTLVERLAADPETLELTDDEQRLLPGWTGVRLRPYAISGIHAGMSFQVADMLNDASYNVEDHAVSRRVEQDEVLIVHLLPVGNTHAIGGAAAHLTADTRQKLREFADLHLEAFQRDHADATWADLIRERSEVLNHFVMALPTEAPNPTVIDTFLLRTRVALRLTGESLGLVRSSDDSQQTADVQSSDVSGPSADENAS